MTTRELFTLLILVNLLFLIWNYVFPFVDNFTTEYEISKGAISLQLTPQASPELKASPKLATEAQEKKVTPTEAPRLVSVEKIFVCGSLGPMLTAEEQTSVMTFMSLRTPATLTVRVDENQRNLSYWVIIPPLDSLSDARTQMRILSKNGLNESFILTTEEYRNGISLGVFRTKLKAQTLLDRVNQLPLDQSPEMITRGSHDYWIDFEAEVTPDYYSAIDTLLKQRPALRHSENECSATSP